jgi:hypothetical protein
MDIPGFAQLSPDFIQRVYELCDDCRAGVPHHTNAIGSIGGDDGRHLVLDLHVGEGGGLRECLAADAFKERRIIECLSTS